MLATLGEPVGELNPRPTMFSELLLPLLAKLSLSLPDILFGDEKVP